MGHILYEVTLSAEGVGCESYMVCEGESYWNILLEIQLCRIWKHGSQMFLLESSYFAGPLLKLEWRADRIAGYTLCPKNVHVFIF